MSNIFSNIRWGILPLVLVTTTAMAMSTPASAMSTVLNFSDSNLTHQEIKESLDNLKREHNSILNSDPHSSIEKALSPAPSIPSNPADGVNISDINISLPKSDLASSSIPLSEGAFTYPAEGDSANITISPIMSFGSPEAILAGVGYAGLRCIMGR